VNKRQIVAVALGTLLGFANAAAARVVNSEQADRLNGFAERWQAQLGPNLNRLSGAARNFFHAMQQVEKLKAAAAALAGGQPGGALGLPGPAPGAPGVLAPGKPASLPDLTDTRFSGAVQSETSTAWCKKQAVVGFNDSGSGWESGLFPFSLGLVGKPSAGWSINGYAVSDNSGASFTDKGFPTVGAAFTLMAGDPVMNCTSSSNFNLSSLFEDFSVPGPSGCGFSDVSVSTSTDGGNTFAKPVAAVKFDACFFFIDKDWMVAANEVPKPADRFITYTNFDFGNFGPYNNDCGKAGSNIPRTAIELVSSTDGGKTWSSPTEVVHVCGAAPFVQGSQVAVNPATGTVYVAWEGFHKDFFTREIDASVSTDGGKTFSTPVKVSAVNAVGDGNAFFGLQGSIRDFEFPALTIGKGKKNAGNLFIMWNDGDNRHPDAVTLFIKTTFGRGDGNYGFSDILASTSTDGVTWSPPIAVNSDASKKALVDHFQPGIAADKTGAVAACWYDRRRDGNNFLIDRECGKLTGGGKITNTKITTVNSPSVANQDFEIAFDYMGDYDQPTSEQTDSSAGFLEGFNDTQPGNQNVRVSKF